MSPMEHLNRTPVKGSSGSMQKIARVMAVAVVFGIRLSGQTSVDLSRQSRNVDFSGAAFTKPAKVGTTLPASCTVGEQFFRSTAPAGANLYVCTSANNWSVSGGAISNIMRAVPFSASPVFDASAANTFQIVLTGDVTSSSLVSAMPGQEMNFVIIQDAAGAHSFTWPPNLNGACAISTEPDVSTEVTVIYDGVTANAVNCATSDTPTLITGPVRTTPPAPTSGLSLWFDSAANQAQVMDPAGHISSTVLTDSGATPHNWIDSIPINGVPHRSRPSSSDLSDSANLATLSGRNTYAGYNDFAGAQWRPPEITVARLPAAADNPGMLFLVTDAATAGVCTSGGGSVRELCRSNGSVFECVGNCGGGAGNIVTHSSGTLTANAPVVGNGGGDIATGSASGNTTKFATVGAGALTTGHYAIFDNAGNIVDGGSGAGASGNQNIRTIGVTFDGGGSPLSGSATRCASVNFAGSIQQATVIADIPGSATVDVQTVPFSSYTGPDSASSITAAAKPGLSSATRYQDATLAGWTTSLTANSVVCFVLSNPATVTWVSASLKVAAN